MKPRCQGHHDGGAHTSFQCVLDEGHPGFCRPYCAPDVDEWRRSRADLDACLRSISVRTERLRQGFATLGEFAAESFCRAYNDIDRAMASVERNKLALAACSAEDESRALRADVARLQAENDALRAIIESGCEQCAAHKGLDAVNRARAIDDAWGNYCRELDAEVVAGVQAGRDDLRGLAGKVET